MRELMKTAIGRISLCLLSLLAVPAWAGPTLPYAEVQAEDAVTTGTIIGPTRTYPGLATEAIGRRAVTLGAGQYVEFTAPMAANSIVVRYSIPDSADGNGLSATLGLTVNGAAQPDLPITSHYGWIYGAYPFNNSPGDVRGHHFYDEVHRLIPQIAAGNKVRITAGSGAPSYTIDLMDFEQVAAPLPQPAGSLSITADFGADPNGVNDSTTAIQNAVNAASSQAKVLWIPQGTYKINTQIHVNNVTIRGAGIWYSTLHFITPTGNNEGLYGNYPPTPSTNVHLSDFAILGEVYFRDDNAQINGIGGAFNNSDISNLWIEHTKCGMWLDGPFDHLTITNVRIRNQNADGVNFHGGVTNSTVTRSFFRNTGDDALAIWSDSRAGTADANDTFSFNQIEIPVLANGIALYGGTDNSVTDNYIADQQAEGGGIHVGNRFSPVTPVAGTTTIARNTVARCGSYDYYNGWSFGTGALWFYALDAAMTSPIDVTNNQFLDSNYEAIHFIGSTTMSNINFTGNTINGAGTYAVENRATAGGVTFTNTTATGLGRGSIYSCVGSGFTFGNGGGNGTWITDAPVCVNPYPSPVYGPVATPTPSPTICTSCTPTPRPTNTPTPTATATSTVTPTLSPTRTPIAGAVVKAVNSGGAASGTWLADQFFDSGNAFSDASTAIDTGGGLDSNPAPQAVYQAVRWNAAFTYTVPGLTAGGSYTVILHWAELTWQTAGARKFNVAVNGANVLAAFDVFAAAGFKHAVSRNFTATANASGQIAIAFTQGGADNPFISGIEILGSGGATPTATVRPTATATATTRATPTATARATATSTATATTSSGQPDLVVVSVSLSAASPVSGDHVVFSCVVKNQGTAATASGTVTGVQFAVDGATSPLNWSDNDTAALAPGASITLTATGGTNGFNYWTATTGTHSVRAWVDDVNRIAESNEGNNQLTQSFTVGGGVAGIDLIVTSVGWLPASPAAGSHVVFSAVVKNQGQTATPAGTVLGLQFAVDGVTSPVNWSDNDTAALAPGASVTLTATGGTNGVNYWTATSGAHPVQAWVDDVNRIGESNETNNKLSATLSVP
jgi:hypothetical protein